MGLPRTNQLVQFPPLPRQHLRRPGLSLLRRAAAPLRPLRGARFGGCEGGAAPLRPLRGARFGAAIPPPDQRQDLRKPPHVRLLHCVSTEEAGNKGVVSMVR
eukprot:1195475-Prorocentrum_minimum.AAC.4